MDPAICSFSAREDLIAQIVRFVLREPAIGALTGEAGSGKSTLLEQVSNQLWSRARVLRLFPPAKNGEIFHQLASQLDIELPDQEAQLSEELASKLVGQHLEMANPDKPTVLLCDDADQYGVAELEQVRLLSNYPLCIILCGEDNLFKRLRHGTMRSLQQRISTFFRMPRLSWKDTPAFLHCAVRGNPGGSPDQERIPEEVAKRLFKLSDGLPGVMMELVDGALISASYRGDHAMAISDIPRSRGIGMLRQHQWPLISSLVTGAAVIVGIAVFYFATWHGLGTKPVAPEPVEWISFKMAQVPFPEFPSPDIEKTHNESAKPPLDLIFQNDTAAKKFLFPNGESSPPSADNKSP